MQTAAKKQETTFGTLAGTEEPVSRFIPYTRHIDGSTLKTKDGYLIKILKIEGLPFETADQVDINQRKNVRATFLRGLSNSRFAIYHHIIRREENGELDSFFESDWCRDLDQAYQKRMAAKRMFINEQYITIVRRPAQGAIGFMAGIGRSLSARVDRQKLQTQEQESLKALNEAVANLLTTLGPYRPTLLVVRETERGIFSQPLSFLS